ncbi:hypothetical protein F8M41_016021 [Gigaspora margarita]|uniref:BTB domain-containing protein n=1 Tax=Gigaspora margarita TaxID=4874 RepID=A0A8H3WVN2_GIGMA|nr:hypothetical protein F8M41_016021 [Gigaspora margarita]
MDTHDPISDPAIIEFLNINIMPFDQDDNNEAEQATNRRLNSIRHKFNHDFSSFLEQTYLCDVTIELIDGEIIKAHAIILCARSSFFS